MTAGIYDRASRIASRKKIGQHVWDYQDTASSRAKAERWAAGYTEDGLLVKIVKSRTYDDQYLIYTRSAGGAK